MRYEIWWTNKYNGVTNGADSVYFGQSYNEYGPDGEENGRVFIKDINKAYQARSLLEAYYTNHTWEVKEVMEARDKK